MVFVPHVHNWGHKCITKKEVEEATAKAIRKEIDHQRTLEAKAWVKKEKEKRQKEESKMFWEWFNQKEKEEE